MVSNVPDLYRFTFPCALTRRELCFRISDQQILLLSATLHMSCPASTPPLLPFFLPILLRGLSRRVCAVGFRRKCCFLLLFLRVIAPIHQLNVCRLLPHRDSPFRYRSLLPCVDAHRSLDRRTISTRSIHTGFGSVGTTVLLL